MSLRLDFLNRVLGFLPGSSYYAESYSERRKGRIRRARVVLPMLILLNGFLLYIGVYGGNIHPVVPGTLYRSAQLTGNTLDAEIVRDHIASVINLRGASPDSAYYVSELAVCKQRSVDHADVSMSAQRLPAPIELDKLVRDFDTLPKPILVHCKAGSDRTGLASTLYLAIQPGASLDEVEPRELTWHYGHFGVFGTEAMDHFFDLYRKTSKSQNLRTWIANTYPKLYSDLQAKHSPEVNPGPGGE